MRAGMLILTLACGVLACASCGETDRGESSSEEVGVIYTTFYPTTYFAERISGGLVPVVCPLPEGADPTSWRPSAETILEYQEASLIILNGAGFEEWARSASLPPSRVVESAAGFEEEFIAIETTTHSHGPAGEHTHEGIDGHTWLDPVLAEAQVEAIYEAMAERFPEHAGEMSGYKRDLVGDLRRLDAELRSLGPLVAQVRLAASHPAYNYLARRYEWAITNFDLDPERDLSEEEADEIAAEVGAGAGTAAIVLWESEPTPRSVRALEAHGIRSVVFSPAERVGKAEIEAGRDYLSIMEENIASLRAALEGR